MDELRFEWDQKKNAKNVKDHGVSFQEAVSVFYDDWALLKPDPDHSEEEERFILLGLSSEIKFLVVCHCCRESETLIRIISARKASKTEISQYLNRKG